MGTGDVTKKLTLHDLQLSGEDGQPILIRAVAPDVNFGRVLEVLRAAQCSMLTNGSPVSFTSPVHGAHSKYFHKISGINSRLDSLQAAVHRVKLPRLDEWHARRAENAAYYDRRFAEAGATASDAPPKTRGVALQIPSPAGPKAKHVYNQYVIRVAATLRDSLRGHLKERGIATEVYYPLGLHMQQCYSYLGYSEGAFPKTEAAARETLALPIFPELTQGQLDHIIASILGFLSNGDG